MDTGKLRTVSENELLSSFTACLMTAVQEVEEAERINMHDEPELEIVKRYDAVAEVLRKYQDDEKRRGASQEIQRLLDAENTLVNTYRQLNERLSQRLLVLQESRERIGDFMFDAEKMEEYYSLYLEDTSIQYQRLRDAKTLLYEMQEENINLLEASAHFLETSYFVKDKNGLLLDCIDIVERAASQTKVVGWQIDEKTPLRFWERKKDKARQPHQPYPQHYSPYTLIHSFVYMCVRITGDTSQCAYENHQEDIISTEEKKLNDALRRYSINCQRLLEKERQKEYAMAIECVKLGIIVANGDIDEWLESVA